MMTNERYVIVCDESTRHGTKYSYFYGGAIVKECNYQKINEVLKLYSDSKNLGEVKRTKITLANYRNYIELLDLFFTYVKSGDIKARVMFSKNEELDIIPSSIDETYCKFYYLFLRYAFSIYYAKQDISLRLIFDDLPETKEACLKLKTYLVHNLNNVSIKNGNKVHLIAKDIEEVDSKKHLILQCMDVVMGLVDFNLNATTNERVSKRGQARQQVFKFVLSKIYELHENFIIEETTKPIYSNKGWKDGYKHFVYKHKKLS
jgi:hypothetical protein